MPCQRKREAEIKMPKMYCPFNSFCVDVNCRGNHYHNIEQRKQLAEILKSYPEHIMIIDGYKPQRGKLSCQYGMRCFERDCPYTHSGIEDVDMRKPVFKEFNKQLKAKQMREKIAKEIEEKKTNITDWNDM